MYIGGSLTNDEGVRTGSVAHRRAWEAEHVDSCVNILR
jgi:hypothetical protein